MGFLISTCTNCSNRIQWLEHFGEATCPNCKAVLQENILKKYTMEERYDHFYDMDKSRTNNAESECFSIIDLHSYNNNPAKRIFSIVDEMHYHYQDRDWEELQGFYLDHVNMIVRRYNLDFHLYDMALKDYLAG